MGPETLTPAQQEQIDNRDAQGQFKEKQHADVEDTTDVLGLSDDDLPAGTFRHPPYFSTADEVITFFSRVEIDDETIEQFQAAARERSLEEYGRALTDAAEKSAKEWEKDNPRPDKSKKWPQWEQARREFIDAERERLRTGELNSYEAAGVPPTIHDADAQTIIRVYQMARYAPENNPDEKNKLANHRVRLNSTGEETDLAALHTLHKHPLMLEALDRLPQKSSGEDVQREMLAELRRFNENAEAMHNQQNAIRHNTGTLLDNYNSDRIQDQKDRARRWR